MRLSAFSVLDAFPADGVSQRDRYQEALAEADACEASGLRAFWVAEHHFHAGGLCPSPPVLLSAIGQRTQRIRIGVMVSVLPFHDPVQLAEEYALLDHLVQGRLDLGVGSGYIPVEFAGFGVDPATKRERFDRAFETLLSAFRGDAVRVDREAGESVRINVRPVQLPSPPMWIAVQRREAIPFVARRGVSLALIPYATLSGMEELASEISEYRGHLAPGAQTSVSVGIHLYVGKNVGEARRALQRYLDSRLATQSSFYQETVRREPERASAASIEKAGFALLGSAGDVEAGLGRLRAAGVDEVLGIFDFGGLPIEEVRASIKSLGEIHPSGGSPERSPSDRPG